MAKVTDNGDGTSTVILEFTAPTDILNSMFDLINAQSSPMGMVNRPPIPVPDGKGGWALPEPVEVIPPTVDEKAEVANQFVWDMLINMAKQAMVQQRMQEAQQAIQEETRDMFPLTPTPVKQPVDPLPVDPAIPVDPITPIKPGGLKTPAVSTKTSTGEPK